jgi:starvation-inducible outer membrane lipoprotein
MSIRRCAALLALAMALGGCSLLPVGIAELNARPNKHYEQTVSFKARVSRIQALPGETLLEVADAQEHRIFVRAEGTLDVHPDDWVQVKGTLVPEATVGGKIVYDVVRAESVESARAPWFRNLF